MKSPCRLARFAVDVLLARFSGRRHPFLVQLNVTNRCNSRCGYCYGTYFERPHDEMTFEQIKTIIDQLVKYGLFRLNLVGGEPLLREDIGEIIDYASRHAHCAMTTNGILIPGKLDLLKNLDTLCISIDGRPENNDLNRGIGSFEKAVAGLDAANQSGIPLQLSSVITRSTAGDVEYMVSMALKYRCKVAFSVLIGKRPEPHQSANSLRPSDDQVHSALGRILELKRKGAPILFSSYSYDHAMQWADYSREFGPLGQSKSLCNAGRFFFLVDYNGDMYPCPQLVSIVKPLNLLRDGVHAAMEGAGRHGCSGCAVPCSTDFSAFFDLKPSVIRDYLFGLRRS